MLLQKSMVIPSLSFSNFGNGLFTIQRLFLSNASNSNLALLRKRTGYVTVPSFANLIH